VVVLDQSTIVKHDAVGVVPAMIAALGEQASWRYIEFFTANIRNPHTRRAYARACNRFFAWCARRRLALEEIRPFDVAAYIEGLQGKAAAPSVKQELAAIRMLFDWLVVGQVMPANPAAAVRGPTHVVKTGKTPVLDGPDWRRLLDAIPTEAVRDRRDRALIATLTYSFARITAALKMKVEDLRPRGAGWELRLREKGVPSATKENVRGDEIVEITVTVPMPRDERTKELLRELAKLNPEDPREELWKKV